MGIKVKKAILIVAFFCCCFPAFSGKILRLGNPCKDHLQRIMKYERFCGTDIAHPGKFGFSHPSGGRGSVQSSHPNDGGSHSSYMQGYTAGAAAGAANDHRNHHRNHSGANRNYNCVGVVILSCTMLACLLTA